MHHCKTFGKAVKVFKFCTLVFTPIQSRKVLQNANGKQRNPVKLVTNTIPGGTMRVPSPSDHIYACAHQFTMNLRYAFNNCASARVRT